MRAPALRPACSLAPWPARLLGCGEGPAQALFHQAQQRVDHDGQHRYEHAARQGHGQVVGGDAAIDGHAQAACADEAGNAGERDGHGCHVADAAHDDGRGQGQLHAIEQLAFGGAHATRRLDDARVDVHDARVGVAHHGQKRIDGQRHHGGDVPYAGHGDEETEQRDGRDGIHEVDQGKHRARATPPGGNGNAEGQADDARQGNGQKRDGDMLCEQLAEPAAADGEQGEHVGNHGSLAFKGRDRPSIIRGSISRESAL